MSDGWDSVTVIQICRFKFSGNQGLDSLYQGTTLVGPHTD
jgi:hypothetical protein